MLAFYDMLWPLSACLILVGIHSYLGIHVIARKVIFVDLALAQIAALGAVYGVFLGLSIASNPLSIKLISVLFTLLGALLFSFTRSIDEKISHEAIIGIIYAAALSLTVLVSANLPHGADEVRQMLAGSILWVSPQEVITTAILYGLVGSIHLFFHKQFFALSDERELATLSLSQIRWWDFLFYATFGVVVTSSVGIGGVLLVFGYLVIPSLIGVMLAKETKIRLLVAWFMGTLMSIFGVLISYKLDLPSGPTIVVLLVISLIIVFLSKELLVKSSRKIGLIHSSLVLLALLLTLGLPYLFSKSMLAHTKEQEAHLHHQQSHGEEEVFLPELYKQLQSLDHNVRSMALSVLGQLLDKNSLVVIKKAFSDEKDAFIKIDMAELTLKMGDKEGLKMLTDIAKENDAKFIQDDVMIHLTQWLDIKNAPKELGALSEWLLRHISHIKFDAQRMKYVL